MRWSAMGKFRREPASAQATPELLTGQYLDIRLIIENEQAHALPLLPGT
jgi:hypothetical protein